MSRLRAQLTPDLVNRLGIAREAAIKIWKHPRHRYFTNHLPSEHSERIIEKLNRLLEDVPDHLYPNSQESFILLASAYLHDIGMQAEQEEWKSLDDVREHHHEISRRMILGSVNDRAEYVDLGLPHDLVDEVALVAAAHRRLNLADTEFDERAKGDAVIRLRLLSALLRLADSLDMDYRRVDIDLLKVADVPQESRIHWWRCYYVSSIVVKNGTIRGVCEIPDEDYSAFIKITIERELAANLSKVEKYLWPTLKLRVDATEVRSPATKERMSLEDFAVFRQLVIADPEQVSAAATRELRSLQDQEERIAFLITDEAGRIAKSNPGNAAQLYRYAADLRTRLGQVRIAIEHLRRCAEVLVESGQSEAASEVYEEIGDRWLVSGDPDMAVTDYKKALEHGRDNQIARTTKLARALAVNGDVAKALQLLDTLQSGGPDAGTE